MSTRQLRIELTPSEGGSASLLSLRGYINARTNADFQGALEDVARDHPGHLMLDFSRLDYLNSTGLATLINMHQIFQSNGHELLLVNVPHHVAVVVHQMGLAEVIPILKDSDEARRFLDTDPEGRRVFENWGGFIEREHPEFRRTPTRRSGARVEGKYSVLVVEPMPNDFEAVLKMRLHNPNGDFHVARDAASAVEAFRKLSPEVVVVRYIGEESDELVRKIKIDMDRPLVSLIMVYARGTDVESPRDFKIWENDFFVEPFAVMELFTLIENEITRVRADRGGGRHQLNVRFRSIESHVDRASEMAETLIRKSPLGEESATRLLSAYNEAVDNARRHGHGGDSSKTIDVVFTLDAETVSIQITDEGPGFDYSSWTRDLKDATAVKRAQKARSQGRQGGLGILLMFKCCSRVSYHGAGNVLLLEQDIDG